MRVLWIESDTVFKNIQAEPLVRLGYQIDTADCYKTAVSMLDHDRYALVIIDLSFHKKINPRELHILSEKSPSTLLITNRELNLDSNRKIKELYRNILYRPTSNAQFLKAFRFALAGPSILINIHQYTFDGFTLDESRLEVTDEIGNVFKLTRSEVSILRALIIHYDKVLSKQELRAALSSHSTPTSSNNIEVHIRNLRKKIGSSRIKTLWGLGYTLAKIHRNPGSLI